MVSADSSVLGSGTLTATGETPFYLQALDSRGIVCVVASLDGFADTAVSIELTGSGILLTATASFPSGGSLITEDGAHTTLLSGGTRVSVNIAHVDPDTGTNPDLTVTQFLRPEIDPFIVVQSTNPAVGTIQGSPVRLDQSGNVSVDFQPTDLGTTEVFAVPPPGFTIASGRIATQNGRIVFHVTLPGWSIEPQQPLARNSGRAVRLDLAANVSSLTSDLPITIQSSDPSRLLVSPNAATAGSPAISMTLAAGSRSAGTFYIQALDGEGTVQLSIAAPGFSDTYLDIPVRN